MTFFDPYRISARRAWHDTFHVPSRDSLAAMMTRNRKAKVGRQPEMVGIEKIKGQFYQRVMTEVEIQTEEGTVKRRSISDLLPLMDAKGNRGKPRDFFLNWDPLMRARVQSAIRSLPKDVQAFGMIMYAPDPEVTPGRIERTQQVIKEAVYEFMGPDAIAACRARKVLHISLLVFAAMRHWRECVFAAPVDDSQTLGGIQRIDDFLYRTFGERLGLNDHRHWARDYAPYWDKMLAVCDEMERIALGGVGAALKEASDAIANGADN